MTKEQVQERLTKLQQEQEQLRVNLIAYEGAVQECKYWLEQHKETE